MYNRALDKIAAAVLAFRAGNVEKASSIFMSACTDKTLRAAMEAIEKANAKGFNAKHATAAARLKAAAEGDDLDEDLMEEEDEAAEEEAAIQARRIRARRLRRAAMGGDSAGVPMEQVGDDFRIEPEVTEADSEDLDLPMDEDGGELDLEADSEDFRADPKDIPALDTKARFQRAMANMLVSAAKKKKPVAKKKPAGRH